MAIATRCRVQPIGLSSVTTRVSAPRVVVPPGFETTVNPSVYVPGATLGSGVAVTRNVVVAPDATPPALLGCATIEKNMNESGTKLTVAGAQPALLPLRTV